MGGGEMRERGDEREGKGRGDARERDEKGVYCEQ